MTQALEELILDSPLGQPVPAGCADPAGQPVRPLPDGDRYLGFIFAAAATRHEVEQALTAARDQLRVTIG